MFRWLNREDPDVIILHSINVLLPCWFYARLKNVPLIVIEHTPNNVKRKNEWFASKLAMQLADRVVLLTLQYQNDLKKKLGWFYRNEKVKIIPNGIDTDRFILMKRPDLDHSGMIRLGMAARFSDKKRQDILIEMILLLRSLSDSIDFRLSLAGDGTTLDFLQKKVKKLDLEKFVDFPGYLGEDEMLEWFQSIDIYLHASEGETLSTSLIQAMSMGLPIIASNVSGITNLLGEEEECGVLVENSGKCFSKAVSELVHSPEQAKQLSLRVKKECSHNL